MKEVISDTVEKLFGEEQIPKDVNHPDFIKLFIKNSPNIRELNHDRTANDIIGDFLFEQTDIAKELKKALDWRNNHAEESKPQDVHE